MDASKQNSAGTGTRGNNGGGIGGSGMLQVQICCNSMELAGDIIQDLGKFLKIPELEAEANFPEEMIYFEDVLARVSDYNAARVRLTADMAEDSQRVKALIVRAEDSRLMVDMETMRSLPQFAETRHRLWQALHGRAAVAA
jgi:hypothetical protein